MKREEAILVLKELFEKCTFLDGHYMALMPAGYAGLLSKGYQILIKTPPLTKKQETVCKIF